MRSSGVAEPDSANLGLAPSVWNAAAFVVFLLATLFLFRALVGQDPSRVVPANVGSSDRSTAGVTNWDALAQTDLRFVVWLVARNAHTLVHRPHRFFDAEQCYPAENSLALGESGAALGVVGTPLYLLTRDPVATFNALLVMLTLIASLAMYWLVRDFTASPPAGIVAGLAYAFHIMKIGDVAHIIIWDTAWTVIALGFANRLFARGRWRDVIGLAFAIAMQVAGSLYPLLGAAFIGLPFLAWLIVHYGVARVRVAQIAALAACVSVVAWLVLGPYLRGQETGEIAQTAYQAFYGIFYFLPGGGGFAGWITTILVVAALTLGRERTLRGLAGDPRWVLVFSMLLLLSMSTLLAGTPGERTVPYVRGEPMPGSLPNLYLALSSLVPGLDVVRGPGVLYCGVHLLLSLFAGIGAAGLLRLVPTRLVAPATAGLVAVMAVDALQPPALGYTPRIEYRLFEVRPSDEALDFHDALAKGGDAGPLLEVPTRQLNLWKASEGVLLSAYHHRPTSYCYNSHYPAEIAEVEQVSKSLPSIEAIEMLREMGFRTIIVHHGEGEVGARPRRASFERFARSEGRSLLQKLEQSESFTAYGIAP